MLRAGIDESKIKNGTSSGSSRVICGYLLEYQGVGALVTSRPMANNPTTTYKVPRCIRTLHMCSGRKTNCKNLDRPRNRLTTRRLLQYLDNEQYFTILSKRILQGAPIHYTCIRSHAAGQPRTPFHFHTRFCEAVHQQTRNPQADGRRTNRRRQTRPSRLDGPSLACSRLQACCMTSHCILHALARC